MQDPDILILPVKLYSDEAAKAVSSFLQGVDMQYDMKAKRAIYSNCRRPARPTLYKAFTVERADDGAMLLRRDFNVFDGRACRYFSALEAASAISRGMLQAIHALGTDYKARCDYFRSGDKVDGKFAACVAELLGGADVDKVTKKYGAETVDAAKGVPANPIIATRRSIIKQEIDSVRCDFFDKRNALRDELQRKIDQLKQATQVEISRLEAEEDAKVAALEEELSKTFGKNQKN